MYYPSLITSKSFSRTAILERFFKSEFDGSWWMKYKSGRPNKFYGHFDNLPLKAQKVLKSIQMRQSTI